jgi:hypothetical protein
MLQYAFLEPRITITAKKMADPIHIEELVTRSYLYSWTWPTIDLAHDGHTDLDDNQTQSINAPMHHRARGDRSVKDCFFIP